MKYKIILLVVLFSVLFQTSALFSQTKVDMWEGLYKDSISLKEKRDMMKKIEERVTNEFGDLILYALREEAVFPLRKIRPEQPIFEEWVYYIVLAAKKINIKNDLKRRSDKNNPGNCRPPQLNKPFQPVIGLKLNCVKLSRSHVNSPVILLIPDQYLQESGPRFHKIPWYSKKTS